MKHLKFAEIYGEVILPNQLLFYIDRSVGEYV